MAYETLTIQYIRHPPRKASRKTPSWMHLWEFQKTIQWSPKKISHKTISTCVHPPYDVAQAFSPVSPHFSSVQLGENRKKIWLSSNPASGLVCCPSAFVASNSTCVFCFLAESDPTGTLCAHGSGYSTAQQTSGTHSGLSTLLLLLSEHRGRRLHNKIVLLVKNLPLTRSLAWLRCRSKLCLLVSLLV